MIRNDAGGVLVTKVKERSCKRVHDNARMHGKASASVSASVSATWCGVVWCGTAQGKGLSAIA